MEIVYFNSINRRVFINAILCLTICSSSANANIDYRPKTCIKYNSQNSILNEFISEIEANKENPECLVQTMYDIKHYVEKEYDIKISLPHHLIKIQNELNEQGYSLTDNDVFDLQAFIKANNPSRKHLRAMPGSKQSPPDLPVGVVVGVTIALCGLFLCVIPIPVVQGAGVTIAAYGSKMAFEAGVQKMEDDRRNAIGKSIR